MLYRIRHPTSNMLLLRLRLLKSRQFLAILYQSHFVEVSLLNASAKDSSQGNEQLREALHLPQEAEAPQRAEKGAIYQYYSLHDVDCCANICLSSPHDSPWLGKES